MFINNILFRWYAAHLICSFWLHTEANLGYLQQLRERFLCQQLMTPSRKELLS